MSKLLLPLVAGALVLGSSFAVRAQPVSDAILKAPPAEPYRAISGL